MEPEMEQIGKTLLEAPVGYVEQTISDIIKKPVYFKVVEQNSVSKTRCIRKVVIGYEKFPILHALVAFDSTNIPKPVMDALLQKKESIGKILRNNNVPVQRRPKTISINPQKNIVTREYEILSNGLVWFQVSEEIRLDFLCASKNC
jgi:chorismate-pyruvate lyase